MYPEFVLIRFGKICNHGNDSHERKGFYPQSPTVGGMACHEGPHKEAPGSVTRASQEEGRMRGKYGQAPHCGFHGKSR